MLFRSRGIAKVIEQNQERQKKPGENAKAQEVEILDPRRNSLALRHRDPLLQTWAITLARACAVANNWADALHGIVA